MQSLFHRRDMSAPDCFTLEGTSYEGRVSEFYSLWVLAGVTYGSGDILTTLTLMGHSPRVTESNVLLAGVVDAVGVSGLVALKLVVFLGCLAVSLYGASELDDWVTYYAPPVALAAVGAFATVFNLRLLVG
jgi:hypothetical protein